MATRTKQLERPYRKMTSDEQVRRLRAEVSRLRAKIKALKGDLGAAAKARESVPVLPLPDADGNYPAAETLRIILAQQIIRRRESLGWSQKELAARARVRQETVSRLETGKHAPTVTTVGKLDRALKEAGA
jgi:DNA-binding XRE family transcriptional regulator